MRRAMALLLLLALAAACTSEGESAKPTTTAPPATASPTTFTVETVPGNPRTSTTVGAEIGPGEATLVGTLAGPDGPVAEGGMVRVERLVGDNGTSVDVRVVGGQWQLPQIRGGQYRVRGWRSPDMAQLEPDLFFLGATETKQVNLVLNRFGEVSVTAAIDPSPLPVGQPAALVTQVINGTVDPEGVVRANPRPGIPVQLLLGGGIALETTDRQVTDGNGNNGWRVRCLQPAPPSLALLVGTVRYPISVPACAGG